MADRKKGGKDKLPQKPTQPGDALDISIGGSRKPRYPAGFGPNNPTAAKAQRITTRR